jgi:hypothetical protein
VKFADGLLSYDSAVYQTYAGKIEKAVRDSNYSIYFPGAPEAT